MTSTFWDLFILTSILQGFLIGIGLLTAPLLKNEANQYLGLAIITLTLITFLGWLNSDHVLLRMPTTMMWFFLFPVFLFRYFILSLHHRYEHKRWPQLLYLPFIVFTMIQSVLTVGLAFNLFGFEKDAYGVKLYTSLAYNVSFFYGLFLVLWSARLIWQAREANEKITWLKRFCRFACALYLIWLLVDNLQWRLDLDIWPVLWTGLSLLFLSILYFGIYRLQLLDQRDELAKILHKKRLPADTPPKTAEVKELHFQRMEALIVKEELYRNPDLSRDMVAEKLGISSGYLSQVVKNAAGKNFVEYVNGYRIEAAKQMLTNTAFDKFSIHAIGLEAGFKSRSAFYKIFQQVCGQTPGAYKKTRGLS